MALVGTDRGVGSNASAATTYAFSPASNFAAGSWAVLVIVADNSGASGAAAISGVTDSNGNTWTVRSAGLNDPGAANAGVAVRIYDTPMNGGTLTTGSTITVAFGGISTTAKAYALHEVASNAGGTISFVAQNTGVGTGTSLNMVTGSITSGDLLVAGVGAESGTTQTFTGDADATNGSWSAQQTSKIGSTTSGVGITSQRKVVTATATQSYDVTLGISSDWVMIHSIYHETVVATDINLVRRGVGWSDARFAKATGWPKKVRSGPQVFYSLTSATGYTQNLTASLSFAGAISKRDGKALASAAQFAGSVSRRTSHGMTAATNFAGVLNKRTSRALAGGLSFSGSFSKQTGKALAALAQFSGSISRSISRSLSASAQFSGSFAKKTIRSLAAAAQFSGSLVKQTRRSLVGAAQFSGNLVTSLIPGAGAAVAFVARARVAWGGPVVAGARPARRGVPVSQTFYTLSPTNLFVASFTAGLSFSGSLTKRTAHKMTAAAQFSGNVVKKTSHKMTAGFAPTGAIKKNTRKGLAAGLSFSGALVRNLIHGTLYTISFASSLSFSGALATNRILRVVYDVFRDKRRPRYPWHWGGLRSRR